MKKNQDKSGQSALRKCKTKQYITTGNDLTHDRNPNGKKVDGCCPVFK